MGSEADELAAERRRLTFLASRRSMREVEQLLCHFVEQHLPIADRATCCHFSRLLSCEDADLIDWLLGMRPPPEDIDPALIRQLRLCRGAGPEQ
jgi:succinate dehydrogenase flavin-adding protein (antitoxin of CptAB toxin-antitoxin module)